MGEICNRQLIENLLLHLDEFCYRVILMQSCVISALILKVRYVTQAARHHPAPLLACEPIHPCSSPPSPLPPPLPHSDPLSSHSSASPREPPDVSSCLLPPDQITDIFPLKTTEHHVRNLIIIIIIKHIYIYICIHIVQSQQPGFVPPHIDAC